VQVVAVTNPDEDIKVVGSIPALGCWQPHASIRLTTGAATYPTWTGTVEVRAKPRRVLACAPPAVCPQVNFWLRPERADGPRDGPDFSVH
jgi:hypothetical protein